MGGVTTDPCKLDGPELIVDKEEVSPRRRLVLPRDESERTTRTSDLYLYARARVAVSIDEAKPFAEFFSTRNLSIPQFEDVSNRIAFNWEFFKNNYIMLIVVSALLLVLVHPIRTGLTVLLGYSGFILIQSSPIRSHSVLVFFLVAFSIFSLSGAGWTLVQWGILVTLLILAHAMLYSHCLGDTVAV
mmetsp:Transcript_1377/g.2824  ORF Transcript_1377/g.2824 Transcript_1377/m.2824 type:complete len:187 (-) Transcript_1377:193-753(-)